MLTKQESQAMHNISLLEEYITGNDPLSIKSKNHKQKNLAIHNLLVILPVSQMASFNFFPPRVTYFTLKSTPEGKNQEILITMIPMQRPNKTKFKGTNLIIRLP